MVTRKSIGLSVFIALVAMLAMALSASAASAAPCTNNVLCDNAGNALRDDFAAPKGYGADILATNTASPLRLLALEGATPKAANENPANDAYFGLELLSNPETSEVACKDAEGWVTFADVQNASPSPAFAGISPTRFGPWPFSVISDQSVCGGEAGRVTIENVHLFFSNLGGGLTGTAVGTFVGSYSQPGEGECEAGGVKLDNLQPGVTVSVPGVGNFTGAVDNGTKGENAFICFVSSDNTVFPQTPPTWTPLEGAIWKD